MALAASSQRNARFVASRTRGGTLVARANVKVVNTKQDVKTVTGPEAGSLIKEGWAVLDVRPPSEVERVGIEGAVAVPTFLPETRTDPVSLLKRWATYSNGGWWVGGTHMIPNPAFVEEVKAKLPQGGPGVVVVCQQGVRSLAATDVLQSLGYGPLAWLDGGLDKAKKGELPTVPPGKDPRYGGVAGLSEALGWTKVQEENGDKQFLGGVNKVLLGVAVFLGLDLLSILIGYINVLINGPAA